MVVGTRHFRQRRRSNTYYVSTIVDLMTIIVDIVTTILYIDLHGKDSKKQKSVEAKEGN